MTKLLLIRHGKAKLQGADRFWGSTDIELSDEGKEQAERLRDRLAGEKINALYCSTLSRARATAAIIASGHKLESTPCEELGECNFGIVEGMTFGEISEKYPDLARELVDEKMVSFPGGESLSQMNERVRKFLGRLKQHQPETTVAIVSHGGPLRVMVCDLLGVGAGHWLKIRIDHASVSIVETNQRGAVLTLLNDISHLKT